ncbi:MAG: TonB-dependent receptor [Thiobacillus sp.]|nr:TonB-dependent receptor [Thiobacillus sp.]
MNLTHSCLATLICLHAALPAWAQPPAEAPATLSTVEVSAPVYDAIEARKESSSAKLIVSREDLEKLDAATIGDILRQLPGVSLSSDTEARRGRSQAADRLEPRIVVDGEALPGGNRMALRMPVELIERIEIIRNSTAEFPAGAGGTINLILRDVPPKKAGSFRLGLISTDDRLGARVGGVYGAREGETGVLWMGFATTRPVAGERTTATQRFAAGGRNDWDVESDEDSGRDTYLHLAPRFTRDLNAGTRLTISPLLMFSGRDRVTDTARQTYANPLNGTGLTADGSEREADQSQRLSGRLAAEWKRRLPGAGEASARLSVQNENERRTNQLDTFNTGGALLSSTRTRTTSEGIELSLTAKKSQPLAKVHLATFGLEARHKAVEDRKRQTVNGVASALGAQAGADTREQLFALWAQDEWQFTERQLLTPGLRLQATQSRVTDALNSTVSDAHLAWPPSLHYLWHLNPSWNLRSSIAITDKPPGVRDLSPVVVTSTGTNSLSNPDRGGNAALAPEQTTTLQLGVEHFLRQKRGSAGLNLFVRQIDDRVQRVTRLESGRYVERPHNVGQAEEVSIVTDFKAKLASVPALTLRGNASTTRLRIEDSPLAPRQESPRHSGNLGFDYDHAPWKLTLGGNLSLKSRDTRNLNSSVQQTRHAHQQLDLYAVKKLDRTLSLRLTIDNVTRAQQRTDTIDQSGSTPVSIEEDRLRGVRSVFLSLEGKL